ncbi:ATP synthase F0 subunit B [Lujinxingia vulgaris]|uniref:ATP synthase subunit b n=1 Tax=Lujinxingia vulgaris TaxID=2600176 RepID=A0A5C6X8G2_9DELT|nr:ATP synthase F0 subunit B [Lujinxingia vulgaris]TXD34983.1 ATP synthase F0 subunit B [Lujinxingia vulgaris]
MIDVMTASSPLLVAAVAIDIDGTLFVQMGAFLLVFVILNFVLIKPYLKTVEAREESVQGSSEEAGEMDAQAAVLTASYDEKLSKARREAQDVRESLRNQGLAEQDDILEEVREELGGKLAEERKVIEDRVVAARAEIDERARALAEAMVQKVLPQG